MVLPLRRLSPVVTVLGGDADLARLVKKSGNTLLAVSSVFPFDIFPDVITIDENKVNVIHRNSWFSENVHSALIEDISEVTVEKNFFLATLKISDSNNVRFPMELVIRKLRVKDALLARKLIEGLILVHRQRIDLSKIDINTVINEIGKIGVMRGIEKC